MRTLILAPFSHAGIIEAGGPGEVVHEDWRETGVMWDPVELGRRAARESFDAIVVERDFIFDETFEEADCLKVAAISRSACNQIDVAAATSRGVVVINTPGRNANAVAELTIALMFAVARRVTEVCAYVREGRWESPTDPYTRLRGIELAGRTAGVVGFGAIGRRVAEICSALGMDVIVHDPYVEAAAIEAAGAMSASLDDLLRRSAVLTLHAPASQDGLPLIDERRIALMPPDGILINTASAELVDSAALAAALAGGRLRGAGYDVYETTPVEPGHPLLKLDNAIVTPHIGGATDETIHRHSMAIASDLARIARGERPLNLVNPEVWESRRG